MELVGFGHGDHRGDAGLSPDSGLFSALRPFGVLRDAVDVEIRGQERYLLSAREFSLRRRRWHHNLLASPHLYNARSARAAQYLRDCERLPDAILQAGACFDAGREFPDIPRFCYLDSTCTLTEGRHAASDPRPGYNVHERERRLYARSAALFVTSDCVRRSLIEDFAVPPEKIHVVYAGIDLPCPAPASLSRRDPTVLFVARDFERKGGELLLRAFARVHRNRPNTRLVIAGCSPRVQQRGVQVAGNIDKATPDGIARLASLYARASVFAVPFHSEAFAIPYAEAMHYGVPCVAVDGGVMPEIVAHGTTGLLVPPQDEAALAEALTTILQSRRVAQQLGDAAMRRAQAAFRWEIVAAQMMAVITRARRSVRAAQAA